MTPHASPAMRATSLATGSAPGSRRDDTILVVTPWLEGGGAQRSLEELLDRLPTERVHVVTLFVGCRHQDPVRRRCATLTALDQPRTPVGLLRAAAGLRRHVAASRTVYSLMRTSHVVLGLLPTSLRAGRRLAGTFHQLPSAERSGPAAVAEEALIRRGLATAELVTSPAHAAIDEITARRLCVADRLQYEPNLLRAQRRALAPVRSGRLSELRLVFAGRLDRQKGLDRLPDLAAASPVPLWVKVVGDGPAATELATRFAAVPGPHRLELVGRTDDVVPLLDWSDAALMPSRYELSPVFVWEAWQRGRSVLASDIPAFTELAAHGPILRFGTDVEFATAVATLADPEHRTRAARTGPDAVAALSGRSELVEFLAG